MVVWGNGFSGCDFRKATCTVLCRQTILQAKGLSDGRRFVIITANQTAPNRKGWCTQMAQTMRKITLISAVLSLAFAILQWRSKESIFLSLFITAGTICYHFGIRLLIGNVFDRLLANQVDYRKPWFQVSDREWTLYRHLRVKRWKHLMPTYESALFDPRIHTWEEILGAMCQAELIHECNIAVSFLPLLFSCWAGAFPVFLITSLLAAGYDLLFVLLQRYNRPRVVKILNKNRPVC